MKPTYRRVLLWHPDWELDGVVVANNVLTRLRGLNLPGVSSVLLKTASVQTFSMSQPIQVTLIAGDGVVEESTTMKPRRVATFPRGGWILETNVDVPTPPPGIIVRALPSDHDVRNTHHLRNSHWEPQ